ncbi:flagellar export chaperone FliS [Shewanella algae]|uniref:flagellar export chaperone FliS n=1 Tax=Shewanella algae TaxID=38313 RepID=UPI000B8A9EA9|nr:flagellar export chaperone FliS [Shewanella algae]OXS02721.1 flagellar biosynthesis protein FliS [Shewanella algae]
MFYEQDPFSGYRQASLDARAAAANPHEMVRMLLDGLLDELARASGHMERKAFEAKGQSINKCLNVIHGLDVLLDIENGGEIASNLNRLYDYCSRQLVNASVENDPEALQAVVHVIQQIREGWAQLE